MNERSKKVRRDAIKLSKANGGYHFGGSFSCAEILIDLYDEILVENDKLILSKGHGCWVYYVLLMEKGFKPKLEGHPSRDEKNGIHCTTGSMGHGLPMGIGMALAKKLKKEEGTIYIIMGDGECQEGTTWESLLIAGKLGLSNLVVIVDNNGIQGSGYILDILPLIGALKAAATMAGWAVGSRDGHADLKPYIDDVKLPKLIIANTIKGKGVSFMENKPKWHSNWLNDEMEKKAMEELS